MDNRTEPLKQRGAALVVALLMLLVLTLLAISGMNSASLELAMAGNAQFQQNAFQASESGIERALQAGLFNPSTVSEPVVHAPSKFAAAIKRQLDGVAQPAVWGASWDSFSTYHFEIESVGTSARNATATNRQGVAIIAPYSPSFQPLDSSSPELTP
jgi:type IV pilus assembly protein PilX